MNDDMNDERIGTLLLEAGLITRDQLDHALKIQQTSRERIVNILMAVGAFTAQEFLEFLEDKAAFPSIQLEHFDIDPEVIKLVPRDFAMKHEVVPIEKSGNELTLAMVCPLDIKTIDSLEIDTGLIVRPFICSSDDLLPCLNRHYGAPGSPLTRDQLEGTLKLSTAVTMLRHLDSLPALPGTVQKVREMLIEDTGTAADLGAIIERDPAIAAKMLKVANSPAYGFVQRVETVDRAVALLGLLDTYSIVVTSAVVDLFNKSKHFDYVTFWLQSTVCANVARELSKKSGYRNPGITSAALLRDIGRVALAHLVPEHYSMVPQELSGEALMRAEEAKLGMSHTEVGYQLARHWDFPDTLAEIIRFHHTPSFACEDFRVAARIVQIADAVASALVPMAGERELDLSSCDESMSELGLTEESVRSLFVEMPEGGDAIF